MRSRKVANLFGKLKVLCDLSEGEGTRLRRRKEEEHTGLDGGDDDARFGARGMRAGEAHAARGRTPEELGVLSTVAAPLLEEALEGFRQRLQLRSQLQPL